MVGVSAGLIPFLEHDDANRALMGSNMQRQAVPLLITEPPIVGTGLEDRCPQYSGMVLRAEKCRQGDLRRRRPRSKSTARRYPLRKFTGLNERTCLNQKPIVSMGDRVEEGRDALRQCGDQATAIWLWAATCWSRSCRGKATTSKTPSFCPNGS